MREGPFLVNIALADPAAGQEIFYRLPQSMGLCRVAVVTVRFTTAIAAGLRGVNLIARDAGAGRKGQAGASVTQSTSLVHRYVWGLTGNPYIGADLEGVHVPLDGLYLIGGDSLETSTSNIQAADQFASGNLWLEMLGQSSRPDFPPGLNPSLPSGR